MKLFLIIMSLAIGTSSIAASNDFEPCTQANLTGKIFRTTYVIDLTDPRHNLVEDPKDSSKTLANAPTVSFIFSDNQNGILAVNYRSIAFRSAVKITSVKDKNYSLLSMGPVESNPGTRWPPNATNSNHIRAELPKSMALAQICAVSTDNLMLAKEDGEDILTATLIE
jgi:hypothetical protein